MANPIKMKLNPMSGNFDMIPDTDAIGLTFNAPIIANVVPGTAATGQIWMTDTLNIKLADSTLQVGQEMYVYSINKTGAQINDGTFVYISGVNSGYPTITKAKADSILTHAVIGCATNNIAIDATANITTYGIVHDIKTDVDSEGNATSVGQEIFLSATVAGGWTVVEPYAPYYSAKLGYVLSSNATNGHLLISPKQNNARDLATITKDPTGFDDPTAVTVTYDSTARTVTLTGTFTAYWRGKPVPQITNGHVSVAHDTTTATAYFYYWNGSAFVWDTNPWSFDMIMIAYIWYGVNDKVGTKEVHGLMPHLSHREDHYAIGTFKSSGGELTWAGAIGAGDTTAANKRPTTAACTINDEDLQITLAQSLGATNLYTKFYLSGTSAAPVANFVVETAEFPIFNAGITNPAVNLLSGGNWTLTNLTNGQYMAMWQVAIPVSADTTSQKYRYVWVVGRTVSTTQSVIDALTPLSLDMSLFSLRFPEYVFINKVVIKYTGGGTANWDVVSATALTGSKFSQVGTGAASFAVSHDASMTGDGSVSNPLATAYTPAVAADWDVAIDPTTPNSALDKIASVGVVKVQSANTALRGPIAGAATVPTFRGVTAEDIASGSATSGFMPISAGTGVSPAWGRAASNNVLYTPTTSTDWNTVPGTALNALDTLATSGIVKSQIANKFLASPGTGSGLPSFRTLIGEDLAATPGTAYHLISGGTNAAPTWEAPNKVLQNVVTTIGDIIYCDSTAQKTVTRLPANTSTTAQYLRQVGNGTNVSNFNWFQPDASEVSYTPTTSANWNSVPGTVITALDTLATSGIVKAQSPNLFLASGATGTASTVSAFRAIKSDDLAASPAAGKFLTAGATNTAGTWIDANKVAQGVVTTVGDMLYCDSTANKTINRLPITAWASLQANGSNPVWIAPPAANGALYLGNNAAANTWLASVAAGQILISKGAGSNPAYLAAGAIGTILTGAGAADPIWLTAGAADYHLKAGGAGTAVSWNAPNTVLKGVVTTIGDMIYCDSTASDTVARVAGNTTTTRKLLRQVGNGTDAAAPAWDTLLSNDLGATAGVNSILYAGGSGTAANWLAPGVAGYALTTNGAGSAPTWASVLTNPMTAAGEMIYGGASGAAAKIAAGTSGQLLSSNGTNAPTWLSTISSSIVVGNTSGSLQGSGKIGEIFGTQRTGINGNAYFQSNGTTVSTTATALLSQNLTPGIYLGSFYMAGAKSNDTTTSRMSADIQIGGSNVAYFSTNESAVALQTISGSFVMPILITSGSPNLTVYYNSTNVNMFNSEVRLSVIRIG